MILNKQKATLQSILITVLSINEYDQETFNLVNIQSILYGKILKNLHDKYANIFANLLEGYLKDIKRLKRSLLNSEDNLIQQHHFYLYKISIVEADLSPILRHAKFENQGVNWFFATSPEALNLLRNYVV